ncbi:MAG: S26 family signal peptidase [Amphiplicatus sp.]
MKPRRILVLALVAVSVGGLGVAGLVDFTPAFVWNASASAALGLYRIETRAPRIGDFVLVKPDARLEEFIISRGYLPENTPLLKRVAVLSGAKICREETAIFIDGSPVAEALRFDSEGREMPVWQGCFSLSDDEVFLLNSPANSLDGRYFGTTKITQVIGVAIPVLTWERDR